MPQIDLDTMQKLVELMTENDLSELQYKNGEMEIQLRRGANSVMAVPTQVVAPPVETASSAEPDEQDENAGLVPITSPMVGTFYSASDPESAPFVTIGASVTPDTPVCIIEAMKVFNEIKAEVSGIVERLMVDNEQAVEYGQPLFLVRPT